tara:strand:+ start:190 stop:372 length:183 start_codon:yes stop_codon:yes gene_type:complete
MKIFSMSAVDLNEGRVVPFCTFHFGIGPLGVPSKHNPEFGHQPHSGSAMQALQVCVGAAA